MVGILGGKMRGVEACYLARQAGYEVTLFDKDPHCAAADLADIFVCADLLGTDVSDDIADCDFILPTLDAPAVIERIAACAQACGVAFLWDGQKRPIALDDTFFRTLAIPCLTTAGEGTQLRPVQKKEEPTYSIEVVGDGNRYVPLVVTRILTDRESGCRVEAGAALPPEARRQMQSISGEIGKALRLRGICTVNAVWRDGQMQVASVDMRLPSRTPSVVYQASGINMLSLLWDAVQGRLSDQLPQRKGYAVCQHIAVDGAQIRSEGMYAMAHAGRLQYAEYFFGCPEALTNFRPEKQAWVAALIAADTDSMENAYAKLGRAFSRIAQHLEENGRQSFYQHALGA